MTRSGHDPASIEAHSGLVLRRPFLCSTDLCERLTCGGRVLERSKLQHVLLVVFVVATSSFESREDSRRLRSCGAADACLCFTTWSDLRTYQGRPSEHLDSHFVIQSRGLLNIGLCLW